MDALERLELTLSNVNKLALARFRPGDALDMHAELSRLRAWLGDHSEPERFPAVTIERALRGFRQHGRPANPRELLLVCHGLSLGEDPLIEDSVSLARLLRMAGRYRNRRRFFRRLYRALMDCYFSRDPEAQGSEKLRAFLGSQFELITVTEFTPDWLATLKMHPDLLDPETSHEDAFENIERLDIGADSWLVRSMVMSTLTKAAGLSDSEFRDRLPGLLLLLGNYPLYAGEGLKIILDRDGGKEMTDDMLGEFSTGLWGNPWLAPQQWLCVDPARESVSRWLKKKLLEEFFGMLSDDDKSRMRRLNFWELYLGDMTGLYFVLGQDAYASDDISLFRFRRHAKGMIAKFPADKRGMHACIMQFEHHHVVEFNSEGSAAYFYDSSKGMPSFYFGKGWIDIGAIGAQEIMQGTSHLSKPIRHLDGSLLTWEGKFASQLKESENAITAFCRKYQCAHEGSAIRPSSLEKYGRDVWSVLLGWGYAYSTRENAYLKQG